MPRIRLTALAGSPLPLESPTGGTISAPLVRFTCLARLPQFMMPRDGIIDTGAPHTCFPLALWSQFQEGADFEWLPFEPGFQPPGGVMVGWRYTFRMARFLVPLGLMDYSAEVERPGVIAQFADSDPPTPRGQSLPLFVVGLWGGLLEGGKVGVGRTPGGQVTGEIEFP